MNEKERAKKKKRNNAFPVPTPYLFFSLFVFSLNMRIVLPVVEENEIRSP